MNERHLRTARRLASLATLVAVLVCLASAGIAQQRRPSLAVVPRVQDQGLYYEIVGTGFEVGAPVRVTAANRVRGAELQLEFEASATTFGGVFLGRADGATAGLESGKWRVRAASTAAAAKTRFVVADEPTVDWGGDHILIRETANGAAVEFDCAHATIDEPLTRGADGHFDWKGTFYRERPGPVRLGEAPDQHPGRFTGTIDGKTMTVTLTLTDSNTVIGPFTLESGAMGRVFKCY